MRGTGFDELHPTSFIHSKGDLILHGTEKNHQTQSGFIESDRRIETRGRMVAYSQRVGPGFYDDSAHFCLQAVRLRSHLGKTLVPGRSARGSFEITGA